MAKLGNLRDKHLQCMVTCARSKKVGMRFHSKLGLFLDPSSFFTQPPRVTVPMPSASEPLGLSNCTTQVLLDRLSLLTVLTASNLTTLQAIL